MKITTIDFGDQEVDSENLITFPNGIFGFEQSKEYTFLRESEDAQVTLMQSVSDPAAIFSIIDPMTVGLDFEFELSDEEAELLETSSSDELAVFVITYKRPDIDDSAAFSHVPKLNYNLLRPLVINLNTRKGLMKDLAPLSPQIVVKATSS